MAAAYAIKMAIADFLLTFAWTFCISTIATVVFLIKAVTGVKGNWIYLVRVSVVTVINFVTESVAELLGGASTSPAVNVSFYAAGVPWDTLFSMALRFPAQVLGGGGKDFVRWGWGFLKVGVRVFFQRWDRRGRDANGDDGGKRGSGVLWVAALDGASFNPTSTATFYAAGFGRQSLYSMALRFPAQAAGAVGGLAVLIIVLRVSGGPLVKAWLIAMCTVALVVAGSSYTGPSMNPANDRISAGNEHPLQLERIESPALKLLSEDGKLDGNSLDETNNHFSGRSGFHERSKHAANLLAGRSFRPLAFGWAYINKWHDTWEQFYVYWICPFTGAILAAAVFKILFPPPPPPPKTQKKAQKEE
ncbi:hypothetical protein Ancab_022659 [Ancistrocladus abbreviatus]